MPHSVVFGSPNEDSHNLMQQQPFVTSPATPLCTSHSSSISGDLPPHIAQNGFTTEASAIPQSVKGAPEHLRTVIRKRQNSESARRSRQRKKVANQAFYERFDNQCKRLKALEEKVAQLAELVRRKRLREAVAEAEADAQFEAQSEDDGNDDCEESEGDASDMQLDANHHNHNHNNVDDDDEDDDDDDDNDNDNDDDDFIAHPPCITVARSIDVNENDDSSDDSPPPEGLYVLNDNDSPVNEHFASDCSKSETLVWRSSSNATVMPPNTTTTPSMPTTTTPSMPTTTTPGASALASPCTSIVPPGVSGLARSSFTATTRYGPNTDMNVVGTTISPETDLGVAGVVDGNDGTGLTPSNHSHSRMMPPFMLSGCRGMERVRISTEHVDNAEALLIESHNSNTNNSNNNNNNNNINNLNNSNGDGGEMQSEASLVQGLSVPVSVPVVASDMSLGGDTGHGFSFVNELELLDPVMTGPHHVYSPCLSQ